MRGRTYMMCKLNMICDFKMCLKLILLLAILFAIFTLQGCKTIEKLQEPTMIEGCVAVRAHAKLGYFNQEGAAEACKVKCSKELPENYCWSYENQQTGCKVKVGSCD